MPRKRARPAVADHEPWKACCASNAAAGAPIAMTAEYGSSAPSVSVTAVVITAMAVATGSEPTRCCQIGTRMEPATASEMSAHGWKTSQPGKPNTAASRPPSQNQPMG